MVAQEEITMPSAGNDLVDRLGVARHLLDSVHVQIRVADEKIRVLFGGTALLAAALAFSPQTTFSALSGGALTALEVAVLVMHVVALVCVAVSVSSAILALLPRVRPTVSDRSLYFFGHIGATGHDAFITEFTATSDEALLRQILSQAHVNSLIVIQKYLWTQRAAMTFAAAVLALVVKQGILLFL